jgi:hypothetical protein
MKAHLRAFNWYKSELPLLIWNRAKRIRMWENLEIQNAVTEIDTGRKNFICVTSSDSVDLHLILRWSC